MGIIRAITNAIGGGLTDQWLEVYESAPMDPSTIAAPAVLTRRNDPRNSNTNATEDTISNGSIIQVKEGQFMLLVDGGKVIDYSGEAGYFKVENGSMPSLFDGDFKGAFKETFNRVRFGGTTPQKQKAVFLNMQEVRGLRFGTPSPVNYFDNFYNAELFLRAHGTYTIRITDPLKFYVQVVDHDASKATRAEEMDEQYRNEFLTAFQTALNRMSADGERISFVLSKGDELARYMQDVLDADWENDRGFHIEHVAIASISYNEESQKLINMRNQGAMLSNASIREGYVQGSIARGLEAAGSNSAGAGQGFFGMGIGMSTMGGGFGQFSQTNAEQMRREQESRPDAAPTAPSSDSAHPAAQATPQPASDSASSDAWTCPQCGTKNTGKFCTECGTQKPDATRKCPRCGAAVDPSAKFCPECGTKLQ